MFALYRFVVASERTAEFIRQAYAALAALAACSGYRGGEIIRAVDQPEQWCLVTRWNSVGTYRRALGTYDVKVNATPLLADAIDEPSAYEVLAAAAAGGEVTASASDRAADPVRDRDE